MLPAPRSTRLYTLRTMRRKEAMPKVRKLALVTVAPAVVIAMTEVPDKLAAAKAFLGKRWLLHPANRITRLKTPMDGSGRK